MNDPSYAAIVRRFTDEVRARSEAGAVLKKGVFYFVAFAGALGALSGGFMGFGLAGLMGAVFFGLRYVDRAQQRMTSAVLDGVAAPETIAWIYSRGIYHQGKVATAEVHLGTRDGRLHKTLADPTITASLLERIPTVNPDVMVGDTPEAKARFRAGAQALRPERSAA